MEQIILVREEPRNPSILIEVDIPNGASKVQLPDVQQLRSDEGTKVILKALRLITFKVLARGVLVNQPNALLVDLQKMTLTLYSEGWERMQNAPLLLFNDVNDSDAAVATTIPFRNSATKFANWKRVDYPKSYIQFINGQSASQACVVIFEAEYIKMDAQGRVIDKAS